MVRKAITLIFCAVEVFVSAGADWPGFQGPGGRGVSDEKNLPTSFGDDENVAWKVPLPGPGPSGPIVVDGRVIVTCASGVKQDKLHVLALEADSGRVLWQRQLWATGSHGYHPFGGVAANTPASDGESIVAFFSSNDLVCFDTDGNLRWLRGLGHDYPAARNDVGMASSPRIIGDTVVVQVENQGESFAAGIDLATGETRWRLEREPDACWTTPIVLPGKTAAEDVVLLQSRSRLTAHRPRTGKQIWDFEIECHTMASATTDGGTIYLPAHGLNALRYDPARDQVDLLWHEQRLSSKSGNPVVHDGRAYTITGAGVLVCGDASSGSVLWQLRLKGPIWASAVVADGHAYVVNYDGLVQVVKLGDKGEVVGTGQIDPEALASPAVADGAIFLRTNRHLWKVALDRP